jgi:predicted amidohydrolase YtcJ
MRAIGVVGVLVWAVAGSIRATEADLVLTGGAVYTVDASRSWASAVAIAGERIVYVGTDVGARELVGPKTRVVPLGGRMLLPSFQDAHVHPVSAGVMSEQCGLFDLPTRHAILERVRECAAGDPDAEWIQGGGWVLDAFEGGLADRRLLDAIEPDRPVVLEATDGHTLWVNSKALEIAGIDADTPDPPKGRIDRYAGSREPSGTLQEPSAMELVSSRAPEPTLSQKVAGLRSAQRLLASHGITAVQDATVKLDGNEAHRSFDAYHALDAAGELDLRVVAAMYWDPERPTDAQIERFVAAREAQTRGRVRATAIKIFQDGVLETQTAALLEPYVDRDDRGPLMNTPERLDEAVTKLDELGFQVHFHAIGDRAIRTCLDAVEAAQRANGRRDARHHISHVQLLDPSDIPRFPKLGVVANFQPLWAYADAYVTDLTIPFIGEPRGSRMFPMQSFVRAGARLAFGSDWSVSSSNPLLGIETAVTRLGALGETTQAFLPDERISLADAIAAYTIGAAYVNFLDGETGSIEVGKIADLIVLDRNLFEVPASEISEVRVLTTLLSGRPTHGGLELASGR